ncbi:MAG: hypothetical protein K6G40_03765 [Eubacterium sp.]|nr:hypothetical protein [Eubacterium sp.]
MSNAEDGVTMKTTSAEQQVLTEDVKQQLLIIAEELDKWKQIIADKQQTLEEEELFLATEQNKLAEQLSDLMKDQKDLEDAQLRFEQEKDSYNKVRQGEQKRLEQQKDLFDMKWKILEEEIVQLTEERRKFELEKEFHSKVNSFSSGDRVTADVDIFFTGIDNELALRKRYKDLMKIFHPDNVCGDSGLVQEINRQYAELKERYCG